MSAKLPSLLLTLVLAGALGLSGCGDDSGDDGSADTSSDAGSSSPAPADDDTTTEGDTPPAEEEPDEGDGDHGRPSRDDVVAGYTAILTDQSGGSLPAEIVEQTVTCFVDELYDTASATTLQAIADSDPAGIDPADAELFGQAGVTCAEAPTG
ncbi:hypothetical protein FE634_09505 [Nocardioides dongxiaopingii]|uniref:hypothetical protein n=1 Tax=Nocardioides sp. S-1144 TaxID=2582905 RepID=UPI001161E9A1|nr:hypothetical protein [Nocardioides sp. S-1144]QCW50591.2 hypothetical protein FE634_09505 [Nocardioides sp. S-1144]